MEKIYYTEPYRKTLVSKPGDATIFYPECGGQPGDRGFADNIKILDTKKAEDGSSVYVLENNQTLDPNKEYEFRLDWDHRYKYMIMHTAQHLMSGLLFNLFNIGTVAVHLGEDYLTVEINQSSIEDEQIDKLIKEANLKILEGHKIIYHEMSHSNAEALGLRRSIKVEGDVRIVEIEDIDKIACGGVHASSTSEIRIIYYVSQEQIRGHVRLYFRCGQDAVDSLLKSNKTLYELAENMSCKPEEISAKITKLTGEAAQYKSKYEQCAQLIALDEIKRNCVDNVAVFETETDVSAFIQASEKITDLAMMVINNGHWAVVLRGKYSSVDFNKIRQGLFPVINAKGGGRTPVFQGICNTCGISIENLKNLFVNFI